MNVHTEREFMREIPTKAIAIPILLLFRWEFKRVDTHTHTQQNIMQLSCIMTSDLKQLQDREDLRKAECKILASNSGLRLSVASCFIHNNLCYCVRPPLYVYCFGLVLLVASMWWTDESLWIVCMYFVVWNSCSCWMCTKIVHHVVYRYDWSLNNVTPIIWQLQC